MGALAAPALPLGEGIHLGVPEAVYHADPCAEPSASSSALSALLERSPRHAWHGNSRLNPGATVRKSTEAMQRGTILHALVLETPPPFLVLDVEDYTTKHARMLRDSAIENGFIPVKAAAMEELRDVAASLRAEIRTMPEAWRALRAAIDMGATEVTLIWRERGVLCRCRYDTLPPPGFRSTYDLKFTSVSAEPGAIGRTIIDDYSYQAGLYPRAVKALRGDRPQFEFIACEIDEPYGVSLHALDPQADAIAAEKVDMALDIWRECLATGVWPGYSRMVCYQGVPPWVSRDWENRRIAREHFDALAREGHDPSILSV